MGFAGMWGISFVLLVGLAAAIGRVTLKNMTGLLIDSRGRYSLTHFQVVVWTLIILSAYLAVLVNSQFDASKLKIGEQLLALMGIAAGSAVLSAGVKAAKDASDSAKVAKCDNAHPAKFSQIWLEEEGDLADKVVSITKYQGFIFTLVALVFFISLAAKAQGMPELPEDLVWLLGISHAGYVGGKLPNKA